MGAAMPDTQQKLGGFHIDKSISYGHLLTTVVLLVTAILYISKIETKLEVHDTRIRANEIRLDRERAQTDAAMAEIRETLRRLDDKMDRILTNRAVPR
tara:strand:- start:175 stop:468 length:294 start_codon:yes stop_codon:yes gene_type:complete